MRLHKENATAEWPLLSVPVDTRGRLLQMSTLLT